MRRVILATEEISQVMSGTAFDHNLTDLGHDLYIWRLPGPSPGFLPRFYLYLPWNLQFLEGKTYQKPIRKKQENICNPIKSGNLDVSS